MNTKRRFFYLPMLFVLFLLFIPAASTIRSAEKGGTEVYMPLLSNPVDRYWFQIYSGENWHVYDAIIAPDQGILLLGDKASPPDGLWLMRLNAEGGVIWFKDIDIYPVEAEPTTDGGYILAGGKDGDVVIMKVDDAGSILWQKAYGTDHPEEETAYDVAVTTNGGYIVAATSSGFGLGFASAWVFKLNEAGDMTWQTTLGGTGTFDIAYAELVRQTPDNGYIVSVRPPGGRDQILVKLNSAGVLEWQKFYSSPPLFQTTDIYDVLPLANGDFLVAGRRRGDSHHDAWVAYLNSSGDIVWQKGYGYAGYFKDITATPDGHFVLSGYFYGNIWLHKMNVNGTTIWDKRYGEAGTFGEINQIFAKADGSLMAAGQICPPVSQCYIGVLSLNSEGTIGSCPLVTDLSVTVNNQLTTVQAAALTVVTANATVSAANATLQDAPPPQSTLYCTSEHFGLCQP